MNRTTKTVAICGAALLTAVTLSACSTPATSDSQTRDQQREEYENTLRQWLTAEEGEKAAACEALQGGPDHQQLTVQPASLDLQVSHSEFDEDFLQGRC
jgi:hypothetical protein